MMTEEQKARADAVRADASNPTVDRNQVLYRMTNLCRQLAGEDRNDLRRTVQDLLARRPRAGRDTR
jgi:hypothetical protein